MKIKQLLFIILLFIGIPNADLIYTDWQQNTLLQPGKVETELNIVVKAKLKPRYFYNSWSYIFDPESSITVQSVLVDNQEALYTFNNNSLLVPLKNITDGQTASIIIKYTDKTKNENPYLIQQYASVPNFAKGANTRLNVTLATGYVICQSDSAFKKDNNNFSWRGVIPEEGVSGLFKYTKENALWEFQQTFNLSSAGKSPDTTLMLPTYFNTGDVQLNKISYTCEPEEFKREVSKNVNIFYLIDPNSKVVVQAELETKPYNYQMRVEAKYTALSQADKATMTELAMQIMSKKPGTPAYIGLAEWVNRYITYDYGYTGRKMSVLEIISARKGVCEHYAELYIALCRALSIPAIEVTGYAYTAGNDSAPNGWGPHAWVLVYVNNKWIPIDPTWGLTQGKMPVSHIGLYLTDETKYSYQIRNTGSTVVVDDKKIEITEKIER